MCKIIIEAEKGHQERRTARGDSLGREKRVLLEIIKVQEKESMFIFLTLC